MKEELCIVGKQRKMKKGREKCMYEFPSVSISMGTWITGGEWFKRK